MIASTAVLLFSSLLAKSYGMPVAEPEASADVEVLSLNITDFLQDAIEVDGGFLGNLVDIPGLDSYKLVDKDGDLIFDLPEDGIDIPDDIYEALSGSKPKALNKRECDNPCSCGTHRTYNLVNTNWNKFYGALKSMSSPLCGPGTIAKTYTASYSYQISGSIDPSFKVTSDWLDKLGLKVGFAYTWGNAVATGYTATCNLAHPCVATFKPWIGVVKGRGQWTELSNSGNKLCRSGYGGNLEIHLPIVRDCPNGSKECGADGAWGHCYFTGNFAKATCSNLGPTPSSGEQCPAALYP